MGGWKNVYAWSLLGSMPGPEGQLQLLAELANQRQLDWSTMANPETRKRELKWACDFVGGSR